MSVTTTTRLSRLERLTRTIAEEQRQAEQRRQYELDQPFRSFLLLDPAYRAISWKLVSAMSGKVSGQASTRRRPWSSDRAGDGIARPPR